MEASSGAQVKVPLESDGWTAVGQIRASQGWIRAPSCRICCADAGTSGTVRWQQMGHQFLGLQRRGALIRAPRGRICASPC
jgi:hypothetical protein